MKCTHCGKEISRSAADTCFIGAYCESCAWQLGYIPAQINEYETEEGPKREEHGQWVTKYTKNGYHKECSVCGARWMLDSVKHICIETPRCYNCGARLSKEDESDAT